jgi:hypothetical protein
MENKPVKLALVCDGVTQFQLTARAVFIALDYIGCGVDPQSPQHGALMEIFQEEWRSLSGDEQLQCITRLRLCLKAAANIKESNVSLEMVAELVGPAEVVPNPLNRGAKN